MILVRLILAFVGVLLAFYTYVTYREWK